MNQINTGPFGIETGGEGIIQNHLGDQSLENIIPGQQVGNSYNDMLMMNNLDNNQQDTLQASSKHKSVEMDDYTDQKKEKNSSSDQTKSDQNKQDLAMSIKTINPLDSLQLGRQYVLQKMSDSGKNSTGSPNV